MLDLILGTGFAIACIGGFLVGIIVYVKLIRRGDLAMEMMQRAPGATVAQTPGGLVKLRGVVRASEQGVLAEPLTGEAALWFRVEGFQGTGSARDHTRWRPLFTVREARDFYLDDGSGEPARVQVHEARYLMQMQMYGGVQVAFAPDGMPWDRQPMNPRVEAYLRQGGGTGDASRLKAHRYALTPGMQVTLVGTLDRSQGQPVLRAHMPSQPLIVYGMDEATLAEDRRVRKRNRIVIVSIGLALICLGCLMMGSYFVLRTAAAVHWS